MTKEQLYLGARVQLNADEPMHDGICPGEIVTVADIRVSANLDHVFFSVRRENGVLVSGCNLQAWTAYTPAFPSYREEVLRTGKFDYEGLRPRLTDNNLRMMCAGLGLAGESGEVADIVKKITFHGKPFTEELRAKLIEELSDVRWYFELMCDVLGVTIEEVEAVNSAKLRKRFPNGFNEADANARRDEAK